MHAYLQPRIEVPVTRPIHSGSSSLSLPNRSPNSASEAEGQTSPAQSASPPPHLLAEFRRLQMDLQPLVTARKVWNQLFTEEERQQLGGDVTKAWLENTGTVGMYMRARDTDAYRALLEISEQLGFVRPHLLKPLRAAMLGEADTRFRPEWDGERCELRLGGRVIRQVLKPKQALKIVAILTAFQEEGWPARVDDPLRGGADRIRLRDAIISLNTGLTGIRFFLDGTGEGVRWEHIAASA